MYTNNKPANLLASLLLITLSTTAQAGLIKWSYQATISATSYDPLGISGETANVAIVFDGHDTWEPRPFSGVLGATVIGPLSIFATSAMATISGGHIAEVSSAVLSMPMFNTCPQFIDYGCISIVTYPSPLFSFDTFLIDGKATLTAFGGDSAITPV